MLKPFVTYAMFFFISFHGISQSISNSIIAAGGGTAKSDQISLDWTMGEIAVETAPTSGGLLTQGFHQPLLVLPATFIELPPRPQMQGLTIKVNPNPVQAVLHVSLQSLTDKKVNIGLSDANGRVLLMTSASSQSSYISIDMQKYSSGFYFLHITSAQNNIVYTYKIVKTP
jgi:hypothetical protein